MPLSVGSSNNLWARLTEGPAKARFAQVQDPKGPRTAHLLHRRATSKPAAGLRTPSRRSDCSLPFVSLAPAKPGSLRAPGQPAGERLPTPPAVPRRPADAGPPPPPPLQAVFPPLHSAHPPGRSSASPALSEPPRGASGGCGPNPGVAASRSSLFCPPPAAGLHREPLAYEARWLPAPGSRRPRRTFPCGAGERLRERPRPLRLPSSAATGLPSAAAAGTVGPSQPPGPVRGPRSASRPRPTPPGCSAPGPPTGGGEPEATQPGVAGGTATCALLSRIRDASATYPPRNRASPAPPRPAKPTRSSGTVRALRPPQFTQTRPPF